MKLISFPRAQGSALDAHGVRGLSIHVFMYAEDELNGHLILFIFVHTGGMTLEMQD